MQSPHAARAGESVKRADHVQPPCACPLCAQAGVSGRPQVRDPQSGQLLHGEALRRYYEAADACLAKFKALVGEKAMPR